MEKRSIEDYLIDMINQRYAKRVFAKLATEHERQFMNLGKDPNYREYEWMINRALEIHKRLNTTEAPGENE